MREYWATIDGLGELDMDMELVVSYEPVLFVGVPANNPVEKYLIMTYDSYNDIYIMRKISSRSLVDMLTNKKTMEETFRDTDYIYKTKPKTDSDELILEKFKACEFDGNLLPDVGAYYDIHSKYINAYIKKLKEQMKMDNFYFVNYASSQVILKYDYQTIDVMSRKDLFSKDAYFNAPKQNLYQEKECVNLCFS